MNTLIRIRGYVLGADLHEPTASFHNANPKYELLLHPELPDDWFPIQKIIDALKSEYEQAEFMKPPCFDDFHKPKLKDRCFDGNCFKFESLYKPSLKGELSLTTYDDELFHKFVQVVGHVQIQELGNCFLSFHIVEPAFHLADGFDR